MGEAKRRKKLDPTWGKPQTIDVELMTNDELSQLDLSKLSNLDVTNIVLRAAGHEVIKVSQPGEERVSRVATDEEAKMLKAKRCDSY